MTKENNRFFTQIPQMDLIIWKNNFQNFMYLFNQKSYIVILSYEPYLTLFCACIFWDTKRTTLNFRSLIIYYKCRWCIRSSIPSTLAVIVIPFTPSPAALLEQLFWSLFSPASSFTVNLLHLFAPVSHWNISIVGTDSILSTKMFCCFAVLLKTCAKGIVARKDLRNVDG